MIFPALSLELRPLLAELEDFGRTNDAAEDERALQMLNLDRAAAELVHFLLISACRKRVLEIGTSNGYSTLWLAAAARANHGRPVVSVERDHAKIVQARENLQRAGLLDWVELMEADGTAAAASLSGPFDAVFFDADRVSAAEQLTLLLPKLADDVLLVHDNAKSHADQLAAYVAAVEALPGITALVVPIGKGLHVAHRR